MWLTAFANCKRKVTRTRELTDIGSHNSEGKLLAEPRLTTNGHELRKTIVQERSLAVRCLCNRSSEDSAHHKLRVGVILNSKRRKFEWEQIAS